MSKHEPFKPSFVGEEKNPTECQACGSDQLVLVHTVTRPVEVYWTEDFEITDATTIWAPMKSWQGDIPGSDEIADTIRCRKCFTTFNLESWDVLVVSPDRALNSRVIRGAKANIKSLDI